MEKDFSAIIIIRKNIILSLPAEYSSNKIGGISDLLDRWKSQYVDQLQGILISYKDVSLTSDSGFVAVEKSIIYYNVIATFKLFCPAVGNIIKGKINCMSHEHIGCLIHNTITASIDRRFHTSDDISHLIKPDHEILFQITSFNFRHEVIQIEGIINDECVELMKVLPSLNTRDDGESVISTAELTEETVDKCQAEKLEIINSPNKESNSPSLSSFRYSRVSEASLLFHNGNENSLNNNDNEKSVVEASLNRKQNNIDFEGSKSVSCTSLPSTVGESDSSSNLFKSPSKQASNFKKKNRKSKKDKSKSKNQHTKLNSRKQNYLENLSIKTDMKHKKLKEKHEDVSMGDSLIDFEISTDFKKRKKATTKSSILSKTEFNNLNNSDGHISLPRNKEGTKKLYNERSHELFNVLPKDTLSSSLLLETVSTHKDVDLTRNTFLFPLLDSKYVINSIELEPDKREEGIEEAEMKEVLNSAKVKQETSEICKKCNGSGKIEKKIKRESPDNGGLSKKKMQANSDSNKHKLHKQKKSKKKRKEKSKEGSKKVKLKSVDDLLRSRKRLLKESSKLKQKTRKCAKGT